MDLKGDIEMTKKPDGKLSERELTPQNKGADRVARLKVFKDGDVSKLGLDGPDEASFAHLRDAVGSRDRDFFNGLVSQLGTAGSQDREPDERTINFMLSVVKGIEPRDQLEAMLGTQMAAVHVATMDAAAHLAQAENILERDSAERAFNKLTRTFSAQMETLKRYRTGGEQKVTVSVSEGGQAIVGNVTQASRQTAPDKAATSPPALNDARVVPMPILQEPECAQVRQRRKSNR